MLKRIRRLWQLIEGQRLRYAAAIVAMVLVIVTGYLVPLIGAPTLDFVLRGAQEVRAQAAQGDGATAEETSAPAANAPTTTAPARPGNPLLRPMVELMGGADFLRDHLWLPALIMLVFGTMSGTLMYLRNRWSAVAAESIARGLRDRLYGHLQRLPCSYFDQADTGDLVQRCTSDVETIRQFLDSQVMMISRSTVMLLVAAPVLVALDVRLALVSMIVIPVIVGYSIIFFLRARAAFKLQDEAEGDMTSRIQENLTGIRVVRAFARHDFECRKFAQKNAAYRDRGYRLVKLMALFYPTSDFLCMAQMCLVLVVGGHYLAAGEIGVGTFFAVNFLVMNLLWPVRQMGQTLAEIGKAFVAMDRQWDILGEGEEETVSATATTQGPYGPRHHGEETPERRVSGQIVFDRLSFAHGETSVLREVTFTVLAGQTVAILGPSGSGKSTLVNLLLRFYDYQGGSILIDGRELRQMDRRYVRGQIGVVMQEPFLYSRSLRENIRLGHTAAGDGAVEQAATAACVHETIAGFDGGYEALVGERGVTLSGGQRQRVALARAILKVPPILILDDALSAVDTRTESLILEALRQRQGRHTTLVIAHRLSTLMRADRIIVLEAGRVVQSGTHQELVSAEGLYRRLWQIQSSLEEDLQRDLDAAGA